MKKAIIIIASLAMAVSASGLEASDQWFDDSVYTDYFITGSSGMSWKDGVGKLFENIVHEGMVIGEDVIYAPGKSDEIGTFFVSGLDCYGYTTSRSGFSFEENSLICINHLFKVEDLADVAILLSEVNKIGSSCGSQGTQADPVFSFYWYDRRKDYMSMKAEKTDSGYDVTIMQAEANYWAKMLEESTQSRE